MEDGTIVELYWQRNESAIAETASKYGNYLHSISYRILANAEDAEECVNDTYLAVWNTVPPKRPDPLVSYVCRIVRNLALKKYHANTAKKRNSTYDVALEEIADCFPAAASVEEALEAKETAALINAFLETLDEAGRVLFVRRWWYSESIEALAALFQTSRHNVSVRLSRIRKALKKYLEKEGVSL